jgi:hypothetical protein
VDEEGNPPPLTVGSVTQDGVVVVAVVGEVDRDTVGLVRAELTARLDLSPPALVVDLHDVAFFGPRASRCCWRPSCAPTTSAPGWPWS